MSEKEIQTLQGRTWSSFSVLFNIWTEQLLSKSSLKAKFHELFEGPLYVNATVNHLSFQFSKHLRGERHVLTWVPVCSPHAAHFHLQPPLQVTFVFNIVSMLDQLVYFPLQNHFNLCVYFEKYQHKWYESFVHMFLMLTFHQMNGPECMSYFIEKHLGYLIFCFYIQKRNIISVFF